MATPAVIADTGATPAAPVTGSRVTRVLSSGWIPGAVVTAATAATLVWYGVPLRDIGVFTAYSVGCLTLPGTLLWRALHGRSGTLATDAAAGTALGFAVEIPVYLAARALDGPLAVLAWPVLTIAACLAVPQLRPHWRGDRARLPAGVSWSVAAFALFLLARSAVWFFRFEGLTGAAALGPNVDVPYQIALVGELKHQMPPTSPFVNDTPLHYHWYVHAHAAAASWVTGIEPQVLILRLLPLPFLAAFLLLIVAVAKAVSGRWWPGPVALLVLLFGTSTVPYQWTETPISDATILDTLWLSPTQTCAAAVFAAAVLAIVGLLRGSNRRVGAWLIMTVLLGAVAGAKATFLPILLGGLVLLIAAQALTRRRPWPALAALGIVAAWLAFAQFVLFYGANHGMVVAPLVITKWGALGQLVLGPLSPANRWPILVALTAIALLSCSFALVGLVGLARRDRRSDPPVLLMAGMAVAGFGATYTFGHPGLSQIYFARSGRPYLAVLAAVGLAALLPASSALTHRARVMVVGLCALAASCGIVAIVVVRATVGAHRPADPHSLLAVAEPLLVLVAVLLVIAVLLLFAAQALRLRRGSALAAIAVLFAATSLTTGADQISTMARLATSGQPMRNLDPQQASIPIGGIPAARWLRDNSAPDDLVATNSHCRNPQQTWCDSRDFWVAGFAERRVLVEGWSYTEESLRHTTLYGGEVATGPYWDPVRLANNDAVFTGPTTENVALLGGWYGVRWLVAVGPDVSPRLGQFATLRFSSGSVSVYEINPGATASR